MKFFGLIIGTEILNRRREDAHFEFLSTQLNKRGWEFWGCNIIKDDPKLITDAMKQIAAIDKSVLFCFGGIGATPDDYTRECAANALSDGELVVHPEAKELIESQFGDEAYPHRIKMAQLPKGAKLLANPINNMPGFQLYDRFFFTPGFPQMAHPMVESSLNRYYNKNNKEKFRKTLLAQTSENSLIEIMKEIPPEIEFSSLPKFVEDKRMVAISVASYDAAKTDHYFLKFVDFLKRNNIAYEVGNF